MVQRRENYTKIVKCLRLGEYRDLDFVTQHEHCFWLGDLNYRVDAPWDWVLEGVQTSRWDDLLERDQLISEMKAGEVFQGFSEGKIEFCPTYRWSRQSQEVSNKRFQPPSYCDRILWKSFPGSGEELRLERYSSSPEQMGSDHRPVWAAFELRLRRHFAAVPPKMLAPCHLPQSQRCSLYLLEVRLKSFDNTRFEISSRKTLALVVRGFFLAAPVYSSESFVQDDSVPGPLHQWALKTNIKLFPFVASAAHLRAQHLLISVVPLTTKQAGQSPRGCMCVCVWIPAAAQTVSLVSVESLDESGTMAVDPVPESLASGVLSLNDLEEKQFVSWSVDMMSSGMLSGRLEGRILANRTSE